MEYKFNLTGNERKNLVKAISEITGLQSVFNYAPTFAYTIGDYSVDRNGTLLCNSEIQQSDVESLVASLAEMGFSYDSEPQGDKLVISVPLDGFTELAFDNLKKMVKSKESLIKKAIGADELPIEISDDQINFAWFNETTGEAAAAYSQFISALCDTAKNKKRVSDKETVSDNDKFNMRVWLISLGIVGVEYKNIRRVLIKNLDGNSA
jgi:hypothetical protein